MKSLAVPTSVLCVVLWVACVVELPGQTLPPTSAGAAQQRFDDWRRTADGWERSSDWAHNERLAFPRAGHLHPVLIASFQLLASAGGLLAFSKR